MEDPNGTQGVPAAAELQLFLFPSSPSIKVKQVEANISNAASGDKEGHCQKLPHPAPTSSFIESRDSSMYHSLKLNENTDFGEDSAVTEEEDSDESSLFQNQVSDLPVRGLSNFSMEPLKKKCGRPPKLKTSAYRYNVERDHDSLMSSSKNSDSHSALAVSCTQEKSNTPPMEPIPEEGKNGEIIDELRPTGVKRRHDRPPPEDLKDAVNISLTSSSKTVVSSARKKCGIHPLGPPAEVIQDLQLTTAKKKRGRPPKVSLLEDPTSAVNISLTSASKNDDRRNAVVVSSSRKKRGIHPLGPPAEVIHDLQLTVAKKKRGRPPKVSLLEDPTSAMSISLTFASKNDDRRNAVVVSSAKKKRGTPTVESVSEENNDEIIDDLQPVSLKSRSSRPHKVSSPEDPKTSVIIGRHHRYFFRKLKPARPPKLHNNIIDNMGVHGSPFKRKQQQFTTLQKTRKNDCKRSFNKNKEILDELRLIRRSLDHLISLLER
jgi:hypothetical protein